MQPPRDLSARQPGETDREYELRLRAQARDRQYSELKRYSMWAAAWAALATLAAIVLGVRGSSASRPKRLPSVESELASHGYDRYEDQRG